MYNEVIELLDSDNTSNDIGDVIKSDITGKEVFVEVKSISQSEFYQAQASGLRPEIKFKLKDYYDYNDEKHVKYNDFIYEVIRTFRNGIELELVCNRGVNNANS